MPSCCLNAHLPHSAALVLFDWAQQIAEWQGGLYFSSSCCLMAENKGRARASGHSWDRCSSAAASAPFGHRDTSGESPEGVTTRPRLHSRMRHATEAARMVAGMPCSLSMGDGL